MLNKNVSEEWKVEEKLGERLRHRNPSQQLSATERFSQGYKTGGVILKL